MYVTITATTPAVVCSTRDRVGAAAARELLAFLTDTRSRSTRAGLVGTPYDTPAMENHSIGGYSGQTGSQKPQPVTPGPQRRTRVPSP